MDKKKALFVSITSVLLMGFVFIGGTYAYFASLVVDDNSINGGTYEFDASISLTTIKGIKNGLIPTDSSLISTAIAKSSDVCLDDDGNDMCTIYKLVISNSGVDEVVNGYLYTSSSSYTSDNLMYRLYTLDDGEYTCITDDIVINMESGALSYSVSSDSKIEFNLESNSTNTYYLVIWLNNAEELQLEDVDKSFTGYFAMESLSGGKITSSFINS